MIDAADNDRTVPFEPDAICDGCGARGAWDFCGDYYCCQCAKGTLANIGE